MKELWRAWRIRQRRESLRLARIASLLYNANRAKTSAPLDADDMCDTPEEEPEDDKPAN